ncbi:hypothetical protein [Pseudomonas alliivorans]
MRNPSMRVIEKVFKNLPQAGASEQAFMKPDQAIIGRNGAVIC